jgi:hypothetical protein
MLEIKATHSQVGMLIEARQDQDDWVTVQLTHYRTRQSHPSVMQYTTCVDPVLDESEYFSYLDQSGIEYRRVSN